MGAFGQRKTPRSGGSGGSCIWSFMFDRQTEPYAAPLWQLISSTVTIMDAAARSASVLSSMQGFEFSHIVRHKTRGLARRFPISISLRGRRMQPQSEERRVGKERLRTCKYQ